MNTNTNVDTPYADLSIATTPHEEHTPIMSDIEGPQASQQIQTTPEPISRPRPMIAPRTPQRYQHSHHIAMMEKQTEDPSRPQGSTNTLPLHLRTSSQNANDALIPIPHILAQPQVQSPPPANLPQNVPQPISQQALAPFTDFYHWRQNTQHDTHSQSLPLPTNTSPNNLGIVPVISNPLSSPHINPNIQPITWQDLVTVQKPSDVTVHELFTFARLDPNKITKTQAMHFFDRLHQMFTSASHIRDAVEESNALRNLSLFIDWKQMVIYAQVYVNQTESLGIPRSYYWRAIKQQHITQCYMAPPEQPDLTTAIARMSDGFRRIETTIRMALQNQRPFQRNSPFQRAPYQNNNNSNRFPFRENTNTNRQSFPQQRPQPLAIMPNPDNNIRSPQQFRSQNQQRPQFQQRNNNNTNNQNRFRPNNNSNTSNNTNNNNQRQNQTSQRRGNYLVETVDENEPPSTENDEYSVNMMFEEGNDYIPPDTDDEPSSPLQESAVQSNSIAHTWIFH